MATSVLDVFNMALGNAGISQQIQSLSENSKERKACSRFYDQCLDYVLKDRYYGFATRCTALALIANETYPGFAYLYSYPSDGLQVRAITDSSGDRFVQGNTFNSVDSLTLIPVRVPYRIVLKSSLQERAIATDLSAAYAVYTARVAVPAVWGPHFTEAFSFFLAHKISPSLNVEPEMTAQLLQAYMLHSGKSGESDLNEQRPDVESDSPSIGIRG